MAANSVLSNSVLQNQYPVLALSEGSLSSSSLKSASLTFRDFLAFGRIDTITSFCTLGSATHFRGTNCFRGLFGDSTSMFTLLCWRNVSLSTSVLALTSFETECSTTSAAVQANVKQRAMASELHTVTFCHSDERFHTNSFSRISIHLWNGNREFTFRQRLWKLWTSTFALNMWVILIARFYFHVLQDKRTWTGRTNFSTIQELPLKVTLTVSNLKSPKENMWRRFRVLTLILKCWERRNRERKNRKLPTKKILDYRK